MSTQNIITEHKINNTERTIEDCIARIQKSQQSAYADFQDIYNKSSKASDLKDKNPFYNETGWSPYEKPTMGTTSAKRT